MSIDKDLMALLEDAVEDLPKVEKKRMFGFEALWADGRIFGLVANGRICLKHPDLAALPGARRFVYRMRGGRSARPARWIDVPESFHDDPHELRTWAHKAYDLALTQPRPSGRRRKRPPGVA
jgi:TfoX/Sxy family transcriptional regulator of competence genes